MDEMTREKAINVLTHILAYDSDFAEAKRMAIRALLEPERKTGRWIPVTERLPKDSDDVLITYYYGKEMHDPEIVKMVEESPLLNENVFKMPYITIAFYIEGDNGVYVWACGEGDEIPAGVHVTAWMPLPEPYKDGGKV